MKTKCQRCKHGANLIGFRGTIYNFKKSTKKMNNQIVTIDYSKKQLGCRANEDNDRQVKCLGNNFSEFEKF